MSVAFEATGPGRFRCSGDLTFETVPEAWAASRKALGDGAAAAIDLGGVGRVDSAGLALVVEWLRWAGEGRGAVSLTNVPDKLRSLAQISELESLLGKAAGAP